MDEIKALVQRYTAGLIDFEGQERAEKYHTKVCYYGGAVSFLLGYILQRFDFMVYGFGLVAALVVILSLPFPFYNRHPLEWLPYAAPVAEGIELDLPTKEAKEVKASPSSTTQEKQASKETATTKKSAGTKKGKKSAQKSTQS